MSAPAPARPRPTMRRASAPAASPARRAAPPPRPALRLVPGVVVAPRRRAAGVRFAVLLGSLLAAGLVALLLLNTVIDQDAFALHALQGQQASLDVAEATLHEQVNTDADPAVLAAAAARLGMVPAGPPLFLHGRLPKGQRIGNLLIVPAPPAAVPAVAATPAPGTPAATSGSAPTGAGTPRSAATHGSSGGRSTAAAAHPAATAVHATGKAPDATGKAPGRNRAVVTTTTVRHLGTTTVITTRTTTTSLTGTSAHPTGTSSQPTSRPVAAGAAVAPVAPGGTG